MNSALLVAEILGPIFLAIAVGMFVSCSYYKKMFENVMKCKFVLHFGGVLSLLVGILILRVYNVWTADWTVLVTLIGWISILKGLMLIILPEQFMAWTKGFISDKGIMFAKVVALVFGLVFTYYGYFV